MAKVGRPPLYNNCLDLAWAIDDYFQQADDSEHPYTLADLAVHLGYNSRSAIANIESRNDNSEEFVDLIKNARTRVLGSYERHMLSGKNPVGAIYLSKNLGMDSLQDRQDTAANSGLTVNVVIPEGRTPAQIVAVNDATPAIDASPSSCSGNGYVEIET